jgi:hypothetical protein
METYRPPGSAPRATTTARATNMLQPTPEAKNRTGTETQKSSQQNFTRSVKLHDCPIGRGACCRPWTAGPTSSCGTQHHLLDSLHFILHGQTGRRFKRSVWSGANDSDVTQKFKDFSQWHRRRRGAVGTNGADGHGLRFFPQCSCSQRPSGWTLQRRRRRAPWCIKGPPSCGATQRGDFATSLMTSAFQKVYA